MMPSLSSAGEVVLELPRLLELFRQDEKSAPELAKAAVAWLSGQWAFQMLACMSLLTLVLQLYCRNSLKTHTTNSTVGTETSHALVFSLAKTAYKKRHMDILMEKLMIDVNDHQEFGTGLTVLLCACLSGQRSLVEFLLLKGADILAVSADGDTALILATYACCTVKTADPRLLDLLACRGVSVNAQNSKGDTPLSIAAQHGRSDLISILLQYGADANITNKSGCLPVDFAGCYGNEDSVKILRGNKQV